MKQNIKYVFSSVQEPSNCQSQGGLGEFSEIEELKIEMRKGDERLSSQIRATLADFYGALSGKYISFGFGNNTL